MPYLIAGVILVIIYFARVNKYAAKNKEETGDPNWDDAYKKADNRSMWGHGGENGPSGCQKYGCLLFIVVVIAIIIIIIAFLSQTELWQ